MELANDTVMVNLRRSERVVLRTSLILTAETAEGETIQDETESRVVNAHGGLLTARVDLALNQKIILTNPKIRMAKRARVLRSTMATTHEYSVAFEFETPSWDFWPELSLEQK